MENFDEGALVLDGWLRVQNPWGEQTWGLGFRVADLGEQDIEALRTNA